MALNWLFSEKSGTITQIRDGQEQTFNFYEGNAMMIAVHEYEEDGKGYYDVVWFFLNKTHAKRCLGLEKSPGGECSNMFGKDGITRLVIYRNHCYGWMDIVKLFVKAFPKISVEILEAEPK